MVTQAERVSGPLSTWDWSSWRLSPRRLAAAAVVAAYAVLLAASAETALRWLAVLLAIEVVLLCLPWRLPRNRRSRPSFWLEVLVGLSAPLGALLVAAVVDSSLWGGWPAWWWYPVALLCGAGLVLLGGMDLRKLRNGDLAFLMGPTPHGRARAASGALAPPGEELLFRAPLLVVSSPAALPLGLLSGLAFVAIHYVQPGSNGRDSTRSLAVAMVAAVILAALTLLSGSVYPAILAHLLNNAPGVLLHLQCEREDP
ncbi:CPBP family intramembrane glutamic endopeptidase [Micromonospora sp. FIMYZ51]|uniref:CPBP family intramembrane glutamic endopeptidase n=1 Tax=Micromonospora sp. FIMYZ51 TaxID=3051832 RepID=UPI00311DBC39